MAGFLKWAIPLLYLFATAPAQGFSERCSSFTFGSTNSRTISSTHFDAGSRVNVTNLFQSIDTDALPAFCRVEVKITTNVTAKSTTSAEVWMPDKWNGRFLAVGNGGFSGGVAVADLAFLAVKQGFAGVSTDSGHSAAQTDGSWALRNDNAQIDFSWRAMHLSVVTGKAIVQQFYGQTYKKAYYIGCSEGIHNALSRDNGLEVLLNILKQVDDKDLRKCKSSPMILMVLFVYPSSFDDRHIQSSLAQVVGSPANWATHLLSSLIRNSLNVLPVNSSHWIPENTWKNVIYPEVLRQCDEIDGIKDGIISNPPLCSFRPETLACRTDQDSETCLTITQIQTVHKIHSDYYDTNQTYIFGGFYPGSENGLFDTVVGPEPNPTGLQYFQDWVTNDTTWGIDQFDFSSIQLADTINPGQANAINPDLRKFTNHQGKILHYVGWAENLISAGNSLHYYETVNSFMRLHTDLEMDDFYRMFMVPGMAHCLLGDGANAFGGAVQESNGMPPLAHDAKHDILQALIQWVEEGVAPERITAAHYQNNNATEGVSFTRPICKYPASPHYTSGNPKDADSFSCV